MSSERSHGTGKIVDALRAPEIPGTYAAGLGVAWFAAIFLVFLEKAPDIEFFLSSPDHGYQLSMGRQMLFGKFPFVDLFTHYGPMVPFTSAIGFSIQNSLIPEVVICSLGYTLAVFTICRLVVRHAIGSAVARIALGAGISIIAIWHLARFYKWYYWLFPLLVISCLDVAYRRSEGERPDRRWLFVAGIAAGVGALYRLDMGVATTAASVLATAIILWPVVADIKEVARFVWLPVAGFCLPMFLWLAALIVIGGGSPFVYFGAYFSGATSAVGEWSLPFPKLDIFDPFGAKSGLFLALVMMAATYALVLGAGAWRAWRKSGGFTPAQKFLVITASVGLSLYPQAMHRTSAFHFLQIVPPLLVLAPALGAYLWKFGLGALRETARNPLPARAAVVAYLLIAFVSSFGIRAGITSDLRPFGRDIGTRYQELRAMARPGFGASMLADVVKQFCPEDESFLPLGLIASGYTYERRVAGIFPFYVEGIFDSPAWLERDMESITADPPAVVLVTRANFTPRGAPKGSLKSHIEWVDQNYRLLPASRNSYILLYLRPDLAN